MILRLYYHFRLFSLLFELLSRAVTFTLQTSYLIDGDQCFQLDPPTSPFVREAFQRYDEGAPMTAIRDWLNEQEVKNTRGQKRTYNSAQHILNNRRYIGEYIYRDIVVPDGIFAIVPPRLR